MLKWLLKRKNSNLDVLSYGGITYLFGAKVIGPISYALLILLIAALVQLAEIWYENNHED